MTGVQTCALPISSEGEVAGLYYQSGLTLKVLDEIVVGPLPPEGSFSRIPDGDGPFTVTGVSTFGTPNILVTGLRTEKMASVYPNPADRFFTVRTDADVISCDLLDLQGRVLMQGIALNRPTDSANLGPGLYLIRIIDVDGVNILRLLHR